MNRRRPCLSRIIILVLLLLLIAVFSSSAYGEIVREEEHHRQLENNRTDATTATDINHGVSSGDGDNQEQELPSCNDVLLHESTEDRCRHAMNCDGEYLMTALLPFAFCNDPSTPSPLDSHPLLIILFPVLFPISLIVMTLLLFRLLGSTAENYFSPALEMISSEFRIVSLDLRYIN